LFHADRQKTDTTKLIVTFRNFANAPKGNGDLLETENVVQAKYDD
jgi:hypothetical protein